MVTGTDKELAKAWAYQVEIDRDAYRTSQDQDQAAARYILAELAMEPRMSIPSVPPGCGINPFSSGVCDRGTKCCVVEHGAVDRLTKERDEANTKLLTLQIVSRPTCVYCGWVSGEVTTDPYRATEMLMAHNGACRVQPDLHGAYDRAMARATEAEDALAKLRAEKPAAEDAELDAAVSLVNRDAASGYIGQVENHIEMAMRVRNVVLLLAARVKELRR